MVYVYHTLSSYWNEKVMSLITLCIEK